MRVWNCSKSLDPVVLPRRAGDSAPYLANHGWVGEHARQIRPPCISRGWRVVRYALLMIAWVRAGGEVVRQVSGQMSPPGPDGMFRILRYYSLPARLGGCCNCCSLGWRQSPPRSPSCALSSRPERPQSTADCKPDFPRVPDHRANQFARKRPGIMSLRA